MAGDLTADPSGGAQGKKDDDQALHGGAPSGLGGVYRTPVAHFTAALDNPSMPIVDRGQHLHSIDTRRSLLPPPGNADDPDWERSWTHLFEVYAPAMERYVGGILRRSLQRPVDPEMSRDIVQGYMAASIEKGWLSRDDDSIRCFRAYLQTQLRRFTYKHLDHLFAARRWAPGTQGDDVLHDVAGLDAQATEDLDRAFVDTAVERALTTLRGGNETYAEIVADLLRTDGEGSPDLATRLDRPQRQMPVLKHRATRRFGLLLFEELRLTVRDGRSFETLCARLEPWLP